jgi:hypothetical protein
VPDRRADTELRPTDGTGPVDAVTTSVRHRVRAAVVGHPTFAVVAGLVVAIAYCSWPIGLAVNPAVTHGELASSLDLYGQPYNWLFILLDCVTGVGTLAVVAATWPTRWSVPARRLRAGLVCYGLFGVVTAIDALLPSGCAASASGGCATSLNQVNLDDVLTGTSVFALFVAAVFIEACALTTRRRAYAVGPIALTAAWSVCGIFLFRAHFSAQAPVTLQHAMLTMTSAVAVSLPLLLVATRLVGTAPAGGAVRRTARGRDRPRR